MNIIKTFFRRLLSLRIPEGDYVATITDVKIKRIKRKRMSLITFKFKLTDTDTGARYTYSQTIIDDVGIICSSNLEWIFKIFLMNCGDYYDLVDLMVDASIEHKVIDGKKIAVLFCNDIISFPPNIFD